MFSRRHPYLFFLLIMAAMGVAGMIALTIIVVAISGDDITHGGAKVGVIEIAGTIIDSQPIVRHLKTFRENKAVKAIVVRIDSPGGGVGPAQEIYREIRKTIKEKKVIASMGAVAASGGYYVAAAADGIVSNPGTITGSIGVIMKYANFEELMRKIGLAPVVIKSGDYKDLGSPMRPMTPQEKELLENVMQKIHHQFVVDIAQGRSLEIEKVEPLADGRIFTGEEAKAFGLVDRLGNFQDAVQWAGEMAGLKGKLETVYPEREQLSLLRYLIESALHIWSQGRLSHGLVPEARLQP